MIWALEPSSLARKKTLAAAVAVLETGPERVKALPTAAPASRQKIVISPLELLES